MIKRPLQIPCLNKWSSYLNSLRILRYNNNAFWIILSIGYDPPFCFVSNLFVWLCWKNCWKFVIFKAINPEDILNVFLASSFSSPLWPPLMVYPGQWAGFVWGVSTRVGKVVSAHLRWLWKSHQSMVGSQMGVPWNNECYVNSFFYVTFFAQSKAIFKENSDPGGLLR